MLGKSMWKKHHSIFDEHIHYVRNDIQKPFKMKILKYDERMGDMFEVTKLIPPPIRKN